MSQGISNVGQQRQGKDTSEATVNNTAQLAPQIAGHTTTSASSREALILQHLSVVRYVAKQIHETLPQHLDVEDLMSAGTLGLIDAAAKFDFTRSIQFKTYAQFRIRGAILDSLRVLDWSPRELRRKGRNADEATRSLCQSLGRSPSETEIASFMKLSLAEYQRLLTDLKGLEVGSLNAERSDDSEDEEITFLSGSQEDSPLFHCLQGEKKERLADALESLPEKERLVLTLYYYEELTMKEIGQALGVVESRVSQIHSAAVTHLRTLLSDLRSSQSELPSKLGALAKKKVA